MLPSQPSLQFWDKLMRPSYFSTIYRPLLPLSHGKFSAPFP